MAKCRKCGKHGLFLKLNREGLCDKCSQRIWQEVARSLDEIQPPSCEPKSAPSEVQEQTSRQEQSTAPKQPAITIAERPMRIHSDIDGLIWFSDGPLKNYSGDNLNRTAMFMVSTAEPSAIQTTLDVALPQEGVIVEPLGYYPSYAGMTPDQRGRYLLFLTDPYQEIEIGYVFVLYYGLERHLLYGDFERAFNVILKLRDVHRNASFQGYSASALIYSAIRQKNKELFTRFTQSIDKQFEEVTDLNLLLYAYHFFGVDIQPAELMKHAGRLGFTNKRYITTDYNTFQQELSAVLTEKYGQAVMPIRLLNQSVLPTRSAGMMANNSLGRFSIDLPIVEEGRAFMEATSAVLQEAHNRVKALKHPKKMG